VTSTYILGIDFGQSNDPTALALLEHTLEREPIYQLRALHRFPLGTPYTQLVDKITERVKDKPLARRTRVAVDATGVGAPVVDLFRKHLPHVRLFAITITGGANLSGAGTNPHVPKRDLISTTTVVLEQRRLRIATALPETRALIDELIDYRRTTSETAHDSYGPATSSGHDDLLLALSLAIWTGEHEPVPRRYRPSVPKGRIPGVDDRLRGGGFPYYLRYR
jgi:hypothetical protein